MSLSIVCANCGLRVAVPDQYAAVKKIRCPECDAVCQIAPAPTADSDNASACPECGAEIVPGQRPHCSRCGWVQTPPRPKQKKPAGIGVPPVAAGETAASDLDSTRADSDAGRSMEIAGTQEDDDNPYSLPSDPQQKIACPQCQQSIPADAVACNLCGFNRQTGVMAQRVYEKVAQEWEAGLEIRIRLGIFLVIAAVMLVGTLIVATLEGELVGFLLSWMFGTLLLSFLLGTYPRLNLTRGKKGKVQLLKTWRCCFIPFKPVPINLKEYEGVSVTRFHKPSFVDFLMLIFLLFSGILPGIIWWLCVIVPEQFDVALTKNHATETLLLYRGRNESKAKDIAAGLRNVTDLK